MNDRNDIANLLPLLISGKLDPALESQVRAEVAKSPELQRELEFLQGMHSVRVQMPRYDRSGHPDPEILDRLARGEITQLSADYSELSMHLESCESCRNDVELLKQVQNELPDQLVDIAGAGAPPWWQRALTLILRPGWAVAAATSLALLLIVSFTAFHPQGQQNIVQTVLLQPEFESRNLTAGNMQKEYQFPLRENTHKIAFQFVADRLALSDYSYDISLTPLNGSPIHLNTDDLVCSQTELTNKCLLTISDPAIMTLLHQGGSFAIAITEDLPPDAGIKPATYEYHFNVMTEQ